MNFEKVKTTITTLGKAKIKSPVPRRADGAESIVFVGDEERILVDVDTSRVTDLVTAGKRPASLELAGPRQNIFFDPSKLKCALVTCGGLCPGLNDIIRSIVLELHYGYGVGNIIGIRHGLQGFIPEYGHELIDLTPDTVVNVHEHGGSILGSSRGPQDIDEIVDSLERLNVGILFMIGGDGTLKSRLGHKRRHPQAQAQNQRNRRA